MKRAFAAALLISMVWTGAIAAKGPQIELIDNKLSINAETVTLGQLLQLLDLATGMKSKVPAELSRRTLTVRFSGLGVSDGVRKMFQGQPFDYVVVEGQGIIVTAQSQNSPGGGSDTTSTFNQAPPQIQPIEQNYQQQIQQFQDFGQANLQLQQPQQQPPMVQTPFGPIPNPRAQQQNQPTGLVPVQQQNSLFPQTGQQLGNQQLGNQQQPVQIYPGAQPANTSPFGTNSPFGNANPVINQNNGLFTTPPGFPAAQR
jgi:hypothetical protein